ARYARLIDINCLQERLGPLVEILRCVRSMRYIGPAMTRIVAGIDSELLCQLGNDLLEDIELRAQRMEQHQVRAAAGLQVSHLNATDICVLDGDAGTPGSSGRSCWAAAQRFDYVRNEHRSNEARQRDHGDRVGLHVNLLETTLRRSTK